MEAKSVCMEGIKLKCPVIHGKEKFINTCTFVATRLLVLLTVGFCVPFVLTDR